MNFFKSLLFNAFFYISVVFCSFTIIILYPVLKTSSLQKIASIWVITLLRVLKGVCGVKWKVIGYENIPKTPCIFVSNHQGQWESFYLQTLSIPNSSVIKKELLYIPIFGWALACLKPVHLRRTKKYKSMKKVVNQGSKKLKSGTSLIMFPEGTRSSIENGIKKFSSSCGYLSVKNNVPVVPICHNSGLFWKNKKFIKESGLVKVIIGKPIYGKDPKVITNKAYEWIKLKFNEIH